LRNSLNICGEEVIWKYVMRKNSPLASREEVARTNMTFRGILLLPEKLALIL
jgi:hypothetical protein